MHEFSARPVSTSSDRKQRPDRDAGCRSSGPPGFRRPDRPHL